MDIEKQDYEYEYDFAGEIESNLLQITFYSWNLKIFAKDSNEYYIKILRNYFDNNFKEIILSKQIYNTYSYF